MVSLEEAFEAPLFLRVCHVEEAANVECCIHCVVGRNFNYEVSLAAVLQKMYQQCKCLVALVKKKRNSGIIL